MKSFILNKFLNRLILKWKILYHYPKGQNYELQQSDCNGLCVNNIGDKYSIASMNFTKSQFLKILNK